MKFHCIEELEDKRLAIGDWGWKKSEALVFSKFYISDLLSPILDGCFPLFLAACAQNLVAGAELGESLEGGLHHVGVVRRTH